eukprot:TRINITY_DN17599_c0_g1_i1.p1 TRINITY_DN17599_c0_g1~~TRINITY_DN17599_c0_g1_i1.p1  ORF type:complete len:262 (-),score=70.16 TRINITY_DN17599_c0_g1_i1:57-842(-)
MKHKRRPAKGIVQRVSAAAHMSRVKRRDVVNDYHNRLKQKEASQSGDAAGGEVDDAELLQRYQEASVLGATSAAHGKFSSAKWVCGMLPTLKAANGDDPKKPVRLLDVGSLRNDFVGRHDLDVTAIDLNPCHPSVTKADFLEYEPTGVFDVVCLCLVINFVGNPKQRGEMLVKAHQCLRHGGLLFVLLPRACFENSRYFTHGHFHDMFTALGFTERHAKDSTKLSFYVLEKTGVPRDGLAGSFPKRLLRAGAARNNFVIMF